MLIVLAGITLNSHAQQADTLQQMQDNVSILKQPKFNHNRLLPYLAPASCVFYGLVAQDNPVLTKVDQALSVDLREDYPRFNTRFDGRLQYLPAVSVYALDLIGVKGRNNLVDKSAIYFVSNAVMALTVNLVKSKTHKLRPDGSDHLSFPSGHTATAFVAAEFMNQEYRDVSPWYSIAGYTMATATGTLRMMNNRHWLSDVVTGAGIGILSTKLVYAIYPAIKRSILTKESSKLIVLPAYQEGAYGISVTVPLD